MIFWGLVWARHRNSAPISDLVLRSAVPTDPWPSEEERPLRRQKRALFWGRRFTGRAIRLSSPAACKEEVLHGEKQQPAPVVRLLPQTHACRRKAVDLHEATNIYIYIYIYVHMYIYIYTLTSCSKEDTATPTMSCGQYSWEGHGSYMRTLAGAIL